MNRSQSTGRSRASSSAIPDPWTDWADRPIGFGARGCRRILGLLLVGLAALASGCSTMTVEMKVIGDAGMNPPAPGAKGARLEVFAFFLKSREEFEKNGLAPKDFLTPELRERLEAPPFLKSHTVAVRRLWVQPGERDPTASAFDVSNEAVFIGLVTRFQDHRDDDTKWRLVLPISQSGGGMIRFYVTGKRLEATKPEVVDPPAVSPATPEKAK